jgi:hypothetical protein
MPSRPDAPRQSPRAKNRSPFSGRRALALLTVLLVLPPTLPVHPVAAQSGEHELTAIGQLRVRPVLRDNADFNNDRPDRQRFIAQRTRFGLDIRINPKVEGRVLAQDSRIWGSDSLDTGAVGLAPQSLDLYEGYVDLRWIWDLPLELRLGRQRLEFGRQRLVGTHDFSNLPRAFDAYKFRFTMGAFILDIFSAKLVDTNGPILPDSTVVSDKDRNFSGAYFTREGDRLELLELYWLRDYDKRPTSPVGELNRDTFGVSGRYLLPAEMSLEIEYAHQSGEADSSLDISAQMIASELVWTPDTSRDVEAAAGFDLATGDPDPSSSKLKTWNQLFPDEHVHLGFMDYVGRQNIQSFHGRIGARIWRSLEGTVRYHWFRLDRAEDAWYRSDGIPYQAGNRVIGPDPTRRERRIGSEIDLVFRLADYPGAAIEGGYSHFFSGALLREVLAPGPVDDSDWAYFSITVDF